MPQYLLSIDSGEGKEEPSHEAMQQAYEVADADASSLQPTTER
jgi:hypothetical protein